MRKALNAVAVGLALMCVAGTAVAQNAGASNEPKFHQWWNDRYPGEPLKSPNGAKLPLISVHGNKFVDPHGNAVLFRGTVHL
jgi:hypothetical protein